MVSWTVSSNNDTAMTAYLALRLAQDGVTLALDDALAELLSHAGIARHRLTAAAYTRIPAGSFIRESMRQHEQRRQDPKGHPQRVEVETAQRCV